MRLNVFEERRSILEAQHVIHKFQGRRRGKHILQDFIHADAFPEGNQGEADPVLVSPAGAADPVQVILVLMGRS